MAKKKRTATGIKGKNFKRDILITDNKILKTHHYVSDMQQLSGTPDALISENGFIIPIERKPYGKKIHDRYVVQLLIYMRLVEEFEGKKPPYGYLILGTNCRQVKVYNTPEKQAWLQEYIDAMLAILNNEKEVVATPQKQKCKHCLVKLCCSKHGDFEDEESTPDDDEKDSAEELIKCDSIEEYNPPEKE